MATTWNVAFEAVPAGTGRTPALGDDDIREVKSATRERLEKEHIMTIGSGTFAAHGWHKAGSAKAYTNSIAPTTRPDGSTSLGTGDVGRLWVNPDNDYVISVWNGTSWQGVIREITRVSIQGTLAVSGNAIPPIIFPRACSIRKIVARVGTAPTGASLQLDFNKNGTVSIFKAATPGLSIPAGSFTNVRTIGQMTAPGYSLAANDYLLLSIPQVGLTIAGADMGVVIEVLLEN